MKKNIENALADLDQAFDSLDIAPLAKDDLGRVAGGTDVTTVGYTCNSKCGDTEFWECGPTATYTCQYIPPYCN